MDLDRAIAERDVALAQTARLKAVIARKTIRAPFRARVGIADIHPGQFLDEGTQITTLQGVDEAAHVDFSVPQQVAATLRVGGTVDVLPTAGSAAIAANIVAIDSRVDAATRNAMIRARIEGAAGAPAPGASVRVRVPVGPPRRAVSVPV
jgi:membrane fusion protein (multidrug efflux system)